MRGLGSIRRAHTSALICALALWGCSHAPRQSETVVAAPPAPAAFTAAPLRNRIRVKLNAPVGEVWVLVGDLSRFPEYSGGLERVDVEADANGEPNSYVCHFRPQQPGERAPVHREIMRWYAPNRGYASTGQEPSPTGQTNSLAMMTLEPAGQSTIMTYEMYYDAEALAPTKANIDIALADIGDRVIALFGGRVTERYVQP